MVLKTVAELQIQADKSDHTSVLQTESWMGFEMAIESVYQLYMSATNSEVVSELSMDLSLVLM